MFSDLLYHSVKNMSQLMLIKAYGHIPRVEGTIPEKGGHIFVANHLPEYRGPVAAASAIRYRTYPWAADVLMNKTEAINQLQEGFFGRRFGDSIISKVGGAVSGSAICWILNVGEAIPVYRDRETDGGTDKTNITYMLSAINLIEDKSLLLFPEYMKGKPDYLGLWDWKYGFTKIPEYFFLLGKDSLDYYAMAISHKTGNIMVAPRYTVYKEDFRINHPKTEFNRNLLKEDLEKKVRKRCQAMA